MTSSLDRRRALVLLAGLPLLAARARSDEPGAYLLTRLHSPFEDPVARLQFFSTTRRKVITVAGQDFSGPVFAEAAPGTYRLKQVRFPRWDLNPGRATEPFELVAGATTYIGDLHLCNGKNGCAWGAHRHELANETVALAYRANQALMDRLPLYVALPGMQPIRADAAAMATGAAG